MSQPQNTLHHKMMRRAIELAQHAAIADEVPVGAVLYLEDGTIVAEAFNQVETLQDPTAHAEQLVLRAGGAKLGLAALSQCYLAVTVEPCAMCAQALAWAKVKAVRFGAYDVKSGGVDNGARIFSQSTCHHKPQVYGGILEAECAALMTTFFKGKR